MKTSKDERHFIRMMGASLSDGQVTFNVVNLIDDVDELESRLRWAEDMLERARNFAENCTDVLDDVYSKDAAKWLRDLEAGAGAYAHRNGPRLGDE